MKNGSGGRIQNVGRLRGIATVFMRFGFGELVARTGLRRRSVRTEESDDPATAPRRFINALQELGPTFVKLGQLLSTRPDLISERWIVELETLQESVDELTQEQAEQVLHDGLKLPFEQVFRSFDWNAAAAASIGQVHHAELLDGTEVVVKLLRPRIEETVRADLSILSVLADLLERTLPELRAFRPTGLVAEFKRAITREIDFEREARNIQRFRSNFEDHEKVVVPEVFEQYGSRTVLVMERLYGVKVTDCAELGCDAPILARLGIEVVFQMAFVDGFFHADPHPGNIWALEGNRLGLLDMGMADVVMPATRDILIDLLFAILSEDPEAIGDVVLRIADNPEDIDLKSYHRDLFQIYEDHIRGLPLSQISMAGIVRSCFDAARVHGLVIPTDLAMLLKGLATIEGVGKQLDPKLDIVEAARPWVLKVLRMRWGTDRLKKDGIGAATAVYELAMKGPGKMSVILDKLQRGKFKTVLEIDGLDHRLSELTRSHDRISFAMVILALVFAAGVVAPFDPFRFQGIPVLAALSIVAAVVLAAGALISPLLRRLWTRR